MTFRVSDSHKIEPQGRGVLAKPYDR